jgi:PKD repeat protein
MVRTTRRALVRASTLGTALLLIAAAAAEARTADFVAVPNPGVVGSPVRFDASTSNGLTIQIGCPSGIDWYRWDFNGDGVTDDEGRVVQRVFTTPGTRNVTLTVGVWAQWCATDSQTKTQTINSTPGNTGANVTRTTPLSGAEQSETSAGDPDGTGSASITVYPATAILCFDITVSGVEPTQAGHVHLGARGANGPPVVNLYSSTGTGSRIRDCVPADPVTIDGLIRNPRGYYIQLHNGPYPLGVVRGQLGD